MKKLLHEEIQDIVKKNDCYQQAEQYDKQMGNYLQKFFSRKRKWQLKDAYAEFSKFVYYLEKTQNFVYTSEDTKGKENKRRFDILEGEKSMLEMNYGNECKKTKSLERKIQELKDEIMVLKMRQRESKLLRSNDLRDRKSYPSQSNDRGERMKLDRVDKRVAMLVESMSKVYNQMTHQSKLVENTNTMLRDSRSLSRGQPSDGKDKRLLEQLKNRLEREIRNSKELKNQVRELKKENEMGMIQTKRLREEIGKLQHERKNWTEKEKLLNSKIQKLTSTPKQKYEPAPSQLPPKHQQQRKPSFFKGTGGGGNTPGVFRSNQDPNFLNPNCDRRGRSRSPDDKYSVSQRAKSPGNLRSMKVNRIERFQTETSGTMFEVFQQIRFLVHLYRSESLFRGIVKVFVNDLEIKKDVTFDNMKTCASFTHKFDRDGKYVVKVEYLGDEKSLEIHVRSPPRRQHSQQNIRPPTLSITDSTRPSPYPAIQTFPPRNFSNPAISNPPSVTSLGRAGFSFSNKAYPTPSPQPQQQILQFQNIQVQPNSLINPQFSSIDTYLLPKKSNLGIQSSSSPSFNPPRDYPRVPSIHKRPRRGQQFVSNDFYRYQQPKPETPVTPNEPRPLFIGDEVLILANLRDHKNQPVSMSLKFIIEIHVKRKLIKRVPLHFSNDRKCFVSQEPVKLDDIGPFLFLLKSGSIMNDPSVFLKNQKIVNRFLSIQVTGDIGNAKNFASILNRYLKDRFVFAQIREGYVNPQPQISTTSSMIQSTGRQILPTVFMKDENSAFETFNNRGVGECIPQIQIHLTSKSYAPLIDDKGLINTLDSLVAMSSTRSAIYVQLVSSINLSTYVNSFGNQKIQEQDKDQSFHSGVFFGDMMLQKSDDFSLPISDGKVVENESTQHCRKQMSQLAQLIRFVADNKSKFQRKKNNNLIYSFGMTNTV